MMRARLLLASHGLEASTSEARLIGAEAFVLEAALARAPLGTWFVEE